MPLPNNKEEALAVAVGLAKAAPATPNSNFALMLKQHCSRHHTALLSYNSRDNTYIARLEAALQAISGQSTVNQQQARE